MRTLNVTFTDDDYHDLAAVKGDRSWRVAIREEFGVAGDDDE